MTDKELKKLKRTELLELMLYLKQELDTVKQENEELRRQLEAQNAGKADVNDKLLGAAAKAIEKLDALCRAQGVDTDSRMTGSGSESSEEAEKSAETEQ